MKFLLNSSAVFSVIWSLASSESLVLSRDWNPVALSVEMIIGPGCLTGVEREMRLFLRSLALSELVRMAYTRFEKWWTRRIINWPFFRMIST